MKSTIFCIIFFCVFAPNLILAQYEPNWESLDSRPLPDWYDKAKIGIFIHWGVFAVPSFVSEWFWRHWQGDQTAIYVNFATQNYKPGWTYQDFARDFTAEFYDPKQWVDLFKKAGARYVVLTGKHHEGYTMWPSKYSFSWNVMDIGPNRDLLGDLAEAVKASGLRFGVYHSLLEWFNPLYLEDMKNNWTTSTFVDSKVFPEMKELIEKYKPDVLWSDGEWEANDTYWKAEEFLAWLYNDSPVTETIVTNDRWGMETKCVHGGFYNCNDRFNPGYLLPHKWENAMSIDRTTWGYSRKSTYAQYLTDKELITTVVETISCGGNVLINIGPTKEGTIAPIFEERLLNLGTWLSINGEAIYESSPWTVQNDTYTSGVWYTSKNSSVYAIVLNWPNKNTLELGSVESLFTNEASEVELLGNDDLEIEWNLNNGIVGINFPDKAKVVSEWAWVLKISE